MSENIDAVERAGDAYELDELLGAYALDAVDDVERRRVEDYLQMNPRAAAEVEAHREVATMLAFTGMDAPDAVWARIAAEIDGELDAPVPGPELSKVFAAATPDVETAIGRSAADDAVVVPLRRTRTPWLMGAAAAVMLAVVGTVVLAARDDVTTSPLDQAFAAAQSADGSVSARLEAEGSAAIVDGVIDAGGQGFLDASALPVLDADMTYQLWGVLADTGDVVSIGIIGNDPGLEAFSVDGEVAALAVTIEQSPGVISDGNPDGAYVGELS